MEILLVFYICFMCVCAAKVEIDSLVFAATLIGIPLILIALAIRNHEGRK